METLRSASRALAAPLLGSKEEGRARLAGGAVKLGEDGFVAARGQYPLVAGRGNVITIIVGYLATYVPTKSLARHHARESGRSSV